MQREYNKREVDEQIQLVSNTSREEYLETKRCTSLSPKIHLVITHHPSIPWLGKNHQRTSSHTAFVNQAWQTYPRPIYQKAAQSGNSQCKRPGCKTCPILLTVTEFTSKPNGRTLQIRHPMNCKCYNIIYLILCQRCRQQYAGETDQSLSNQINRHRSDIRNRKYEGKPMTRHFNCAEHSIINMRVMAIYKILAPSATKCKAKESQWIRLLDSCHLKA